MADSPTIANALHDQGWWAAAALFGAMVWRSLSIGTRIGRMEQRQEDQGRQLDYLVSRIDSYTDK